MKFSTFLNTLSLKDKINYLLGRLSVKLIDNQKRYHEIQTVRSFYDHISNDGYEIYRNETVIKLRKEQEVVTLRKNSSDNSVFKQIFIEKEYEAVIDCAIINNVNISTIVDAGSNIGLTSLKFLSFFPNAAIFCLEPDSANFKILNENLKNYQNITLLNKALWYKNEMVSLNNNFRDGQEWSRSVSSNVDSDSKIEGITLNELIQNNNLTSIDLIKIDIEGAEARIFKPENDLSFLDKVKIISIEIHNEFNCRENIYEILRGNGFRLFNSKELTIGIR